jgi:thiol:disulfide interchange protein DsbD
LEIPVEVAGASGQNEVGATLTRGPKDAYSEDAFGQALKIGGLQVFLFVFVSGFLTSLTPCVYPMIPITISIIGARSAQSQRSRAFLLSLSYVLGIAFTYSLLGLFAAFSGALFGSALSNPWVVGFVGLVFVAMALSMFGLFELQVPAVIRDKFGNRSTGSGFGGAFLAGLFSGIVASPCIGPVLVSILTYVAQTKNALFGFSLLFTFALGMGLLFLAIGTFSGLTSKIPKSGAQEMSLPG